MSQTPETGVLTLQQEPEWLQTARRQDAKLTRGFYGYGPRGFSTGLNTRADAHRHHLLKAYDALLAENERLTAEIAERNRKDNKRFDVEMDIKAFLTEQGNELNAARAEAQQLRGEVAGLKELRAQVAEMLEDFANGCRAGIEDDEIGAKWYGVKVERGRNLRWAELKCKELGINWPIKPIPYKGNLPEPPARTCHECGEAYWANCITCREEVGEPTVLLLPPAPPPSVAPAPPMEDDKLNQVPGMPHARCHGCGLPSHVARCQNEKCPMKPTKPTGWNANVAAADFSQEGGEQS